MITQQSVSVIEAVFNADASLATGEDECVLYREDLEALLDHISDLEYEQARLRGTAQLADLHAAFERRAD